MEKTSIATIMNRITCTLTILMIGLTIVSLGSCGNLSKSQGSNSSIQSSSTTPSSPVAQSPATVSQSPTTTHSLPTASDSSGSTTESANTIPITIYKADSQCVNFVPERVQVPADRPMEGAVGEVLEIYSTADFKLSGYRVSLNDGVATIDLRLPPNSPRKITSLSICEQYALFGSLRETLIQNPTWNIKSVRFTERGEEIRP
jgi:hypothetical protein